MARAGLRSQEFLPGLPYGAGTQRLGHPLFQNRSETAGPGVGSWNSAACRFGTLYRGAGQPGCNSVQVSHAGGRDLISGAILLPGMSHICRGVHARCTPRSFQGCRLSRCLLGWVSCWKQGFLGSAGVVSQVQGCALGWPWGQPCLSHPHTGSPREGVLSSSWDRNLALLGVPTAHLKPWLYLLLVLSREAAGGGSGS